MKRCGLCSVHQRGQKAHQDRLILGPAGKQLQIAVLVAQQIGHSDVLRQSGLQVVLVAVLRLQPHVAAALSNGFLKGFHIPQIVDLHKKIPPINLFVLDVFRFGTVLFSVPRLDYYYTDFRVFFNAQSKHIYILHKQVFI